MSQLTNIIRRKLKITMNQSLYLIIDNRSITSMSKPLAEVYREFKDKDDGFLYVGKASNSKFICWLSRFLKGNGSPARKLPILSLFNQND